MSDLLPRKCIKGTTAGQESERATIKSVMALKKAEQRAKEKMQLEIEDVRRIETGKEGWKGETPCPAQAFQGPGGKLRSNFG